MICRLFFAFLFFIGILSAKSFEYKTKIVSISGNEATTGPVFGVPKGASGVVVHHFDKKHSTIVARAILIDKDKIIFKKYNDLKQDVLPVPKLLPKVGDSVVLNYLYNHGLIIAPDFETYKNILQRYKSVKWLHPDLFAAELFSNNNPSPNRENFQTMCKDYSFSLLFFAINDKGYFVDCNSFRVIKKVDITPPKSFMVPFYSRIKNIDAKWFNFGKSKIEDYNSYYSSLLGI